MLALSLDMAATASSWVANSTSASPVTRPSGPISMWTLTGFSGEKNCKGEKKCKKDMWVPFAPAAGSKLCQFQCQRLSSYPTYNVDVRLCGSVRETSHVDAVARCALEWRPTVAVASIRYTFTGIREISTWKLCCSYVWMNTQQGPSTGWILIMQIRFSESILRPTDLHHSLHGASCHRILLGWPCCSRRGRQTAGRRGRVSACPWASAAAHSGSAPQHGYSWRSQCTYEHGHATVRRTCGRRGCLFSCLIKLGYAEAHW